MPKTAFDIKLSKGLTCFLLSRKRLRTGHGIERLIQQELKRRTRKICVFPDVESLPRLVSAVLVKIDDAWASSAKRCLPEAEVDMAC